MTKQRRDGAPVGDLLLEIEGRKEPIRLDETLVRKREIVPSPGTPTKLAAFLAKKGVHNALSLLELQAQGVDLADWALEANVERLEFEALIQTLAASVSPDARERLTRSLQRPRMTGHIDWTNPILLREYEKQGLRPLAPLRREEFLKLRFRNLLPYLIPSGPKKAVDLRPFLGDARNQVSRGTCAVFAATAVAEAFEYFRDRRNGFVDLAEQFGWWYRGGGQRYSAGGYDCSWALDDIREMGTCEEVQLPYHGVQINNNHTQVPIPDKAMDRAQFYRVGPIVGLPWEDVAAIKSVLETGRCVAYASNLDGWNTYTGEIVMPPAGTARGGAHCTTIVGYIDDDSLPTELGGGHFIVRNSWGGANNPDHNLGPEYGGHLLMPYAWYRLYAGWPVTTADRNDASTDNQWLAEYYDNKELRGAPLNSVTIEIPLFGIPALGFDVDVDVPDRVPAIDFNWGGGSPVQVSLPFLGTVVDALPTDNFSARFSKVQRFREGWYRFRLRGDDGVRLYVDDRLVINAWQDPASAEYAAEHYMTGGDHVLRVDYYEAQRAANLSLQMEPIQWRYDLFATGGLSGAPTASFEDTLTALEWRHAPPVLPLAPSLERGQFGLRGSARLWFKGGSYRFHALHSGRFRLYIDGVLQYEDTDGTRDSSDPVMLAAGTHDVRLEFENLATIPTAASHTYYKAFCKFGWSDETWHAKFYRNSEAERLHAPGAMDGVVDANHLFFRTSGLTGPVRVQHDYPRDPFNDLGLSFTDWDAFKMGVTGWPTDFELRYFGTWINRKVFVAQAGYYNLELKASEGFRAIVDGKEITRNLEFIADDPYNGDVYLDRGVHDISVEYNGTIWGGTLHLRLAPVEWNVAYRTGRDLAAAPVAFATLNTVAEIATRSAEFFRADDFSAVATRTIWLPVGKYHLAVKSDDGVRVKIGQRTLIDAWVDQAATDYNAHYEHAGGPVTVTLEYYQGYGGKTLQFTLGDHEYYGEYYRGTTLNWLPAGSSLRRIAPIAYRYEGDINFDFGHGSYLPRVGATDFSARWMGKVTLPVGRWRIEATCDDGIRFYVGGRLLIDSWNEQGLATHTREIDLVGRSHDVKVEYFQKSGRGVCRVQYIRVI
jgi:hypothetical protein